MPRNNNIQFRRGSSNEWPSGILLSSGEPGFETDTFRLKIGNGSTVWSGLNYINIPPTGFIGGNNIGITLGPNGSSATIAFTGGNFNAGTITANLNGNATTVTNGVYTTGNQTIGGVKTFSSQIVGQIDLNVPNATISSAFNAANIFTVNPSNIGFIAPTGSPATHFPIFTSSPSGTIRSVFSRTASQVLSDIGGYPISNPSGYTTNVGTVTGTGAANHIAYWTSTSGIAHDSNQLVWDSTNNRLGIGTTSPQDTLHFVGNMQQSWAGPDIRIGTFYDNNWRMGINYGLANRTLNIFSTTNDTGGNIIFSTRLASGVSATDYGSERMRINSSGNVGIGTASPGATLDVRGSAVFNEDGADNDFRVEGDTDANLLFVDASTDRVGVGTSTPGYKLQVAGSFGATTKSFRIDHPSRPNYTLEYGSLESPYHGVRLTGRGVVVKGSGMVQLPDYLKDLIHNDDTINIQITNIKHGKTIYLEEIDLQNNQFIVKIDRAKSLGELQFCWTLTGVRKDVDHLIVEKRNI